MNVYAGKVPGVERLILLRAWDVLPSNGNFDADPQVAPISEFENITLYLSYARGDEGGAVSFIIEVSPYTSDSVAFADTPIWYGVSHYQALDLDAGVDADARLQREILTYQATGAGTETWVYGPIHVGRTCERMRVRAAESGDISSPGECAIVALGY